MTVLYHHSLIEASSEYDAAGIAGVVAVGGDEFDVYCLMCAVEWLSHALFSLDSDLKTIADRMIDAVQRMGASESAVSVVSYLGNYFP